MSNATYNRLWAEAVSELTEQVHLEDPSLIDGSEAPEAHRPTSIVQTFQHLACLYIKYLQIFKRLEKCYDCMVHPQKRAEVLKVLELVIRRVIELKHSLVRFNPPNPAVRRGPGKPEKPFPWEYVSLDDILVDLKLPPETLEVPVPKYFKENALPEHRVRDKIVSSYMKARHGEEKIMIEDGMENEANSGNGGIQMDMASAIDAIQRNERGRQGKQRALLVKELREEERRRRNYDAAAHLETDPEIAAIGIQRLFRGFSSRVKAAVAREEELVFIGMQPPKRSERTRDIELTSELATAYRKRKTEQSDNQIAYVKALDDLKEVVKEEEGPHMRAELRSERTDWVTTVIQTTKVIPDDLRGFYASSDPSSEQQYHHLDKKAQAKETGGGDADKKEEKKKKTKGGKGKKGKAGSKSQPNEDKPFELPLLQGPSELTTSMHAEIKTYEADWADRDERDNFAQRHDVELAKRSIREDVRMEVREQVDEMLRMNLKKIKLQLTKGGGAGKKKGGKKEKKKSKKKKGGKKDKKKKKKALPGDKISDLKNMSVEEMLATLVEARVVNNYRDRHIQDLIGDFNYLGTVQQHTESQQTAWLPPNPSMAQLRAAITEYCVLPLGSAEIKEKLQDAHNVKSLMLYGPSGSGKTMMCEAVANELGALLINISPEKVKGLFPGKSGSAKLCHMIYSIAKEKAFSPIVVYMDQCDQFFVGKKKSAGGDKDAPGRFRDDLMTYKNALSKNERIVFLGATSHPEKGESRDFKAFFDKMLHVPYPDYPSRLMLWRSRIQAQLDAVREDSEIPESFDLSTLAEISEGFSAGDICQAAKKTLTHRRVDRLDKRPHDDAEFLNALAHSAVRRTSSSADTFRVFTAKITGLEDERRRVQAEKNGDAGDGGAGSSGGKDQKKKKKKKGGGKKGGKKK